MLQHNPYYYHPQPAARLAADDVFSVIRSRPDWSALFVQGKMLGILVVDIPHNVSTLPSRVHIINNVCYLAAYSGVVNGLVDDTQYFVPPIYDLQQPDDFYLTKDAEITAINHRLKQLDPTSAEAKQLQQSRHALSIALQKEIFSHFNLLDATGVRYRNIVDIFADAKRGLPPGGTGECCAPRLLQYALAQGLKPLQLAEFWYGASPRTLNRHHASFYPSCIEKCSPLLRYQLGPMPVSDVLATDHTSNIRILLEDESLIVLSKPAGLLSVAAKDLTLPNVEDHLHSLYPHVKGPMLVHRLDQATSGLLIAAKDARTHKLLQQQFQERFVHKRYVALLRGRLASRCGLLSLPLTVNPDDRPRQVVDFQFGKKAVTYYEVLSVDQGFTRIALYPHTGRTHQLRVHCASMFGLDHPMLGDTLYDILDASTSPAVNQRLMLHAEEIVFTHPHIQELCRVVDSAPF